MSFSVFMALVYHGGSDVSENKIVTARDKCRGLSDSLVNSSMTKRTTYRFATFPPHRHKVGFTFTPDVFFDNYRSSSRRNLAEQNETR
mgnify:CR=1 FL=1